MKKNRNIIEKMSIIKKYCDNSKSKYISCDFDDFNNMSEEDYLELSRKYPFLSECYINFVKIFGAPRISWLYILPFKNEDVPTVYDSLSSLQEYWDHGKEGYLPFAEDGGSLIYCFNDKGEVYSFSLDFYDGKPEYLASSFEEFMDTYLLGAKYKEFLDMEDNPYYDFIKAQGWVKE